MGTQRQFPNKDDPAVKNGIMTAELFSYAIAPRTNLRLVIALAYFLYNRRKRVRVLGVRQERGPRLSRALPHKCARGGTTGICTFTSQGARFLHKKTMIPLRRTRWTDEIS
jgi:hypothetical protein